MTLTKKEILLKGISESSSRKEIDDYESGIIKTKSYKEVLNSINSGK